MSDNQPVEPTDEESHAEEERRRLAKIYMDAEDDADEARWDL